jgi:hypothetical protein
MKTNFAPVDTMGDMAQHSTAYSSNVTSILGAITSGNVDPRLKVSSSPVKNGLAAISDALESFHDNVEQGNLDTARAYLLLMMHSKPEQVIRPY